jgi:hypothetical protein
MLQLWDRKLELFALLNEIKQTMTTVAASHQTGEDTRELLLRNETLIQENLDTLFRYHELLTALFEVKNLLFVDLENAHSCQRLSEAMKASAAKDL